MKNNFPNIIKSVGLEIECGVWKSRLNNLVKNFSHVKVGTDGSVCVEKPNVECEDVWMENAEIRYWSEDLNSLLEFIRYCWEEIGIVQNSSCGNHIHVKFRNFVPFCFVPFTCYFLEMYKMRYANNTKYMLRLRNNYCKYYKYSDDMIGRMLRGECDSGERYKFINFLSFPKHQTIEFRVMPHAESCNEHMSQVMFILDVVDRWVSKDRVLCKAKHLLPEQEYIQEEDVIIIEEEGGGSDEIQIIL